MKKLFVFAALVAAAILTIAGGCDLGNNTGPEPTAKETAGAAISAVETAEDAAAVAEALGGIPGVIVPAGFAEAAGEDFDAVRDEIKALLDAIANAQDDDAVAAAVDALNDYLNEVVNPPAPATYTVTFTDPEGGSPDPQTKQVTNGQPYGALAAVSRDGYTLAGWFTAEEGGAEVTAATVVNLTGNQTLYAKWHKDSAVSVTLGGEPQAQDLGSLGNPATSIDWSDNGTLTATVDTSDTWASGGTFAWYLDGVPLTGADAAENDSDNEVVIHAQNYLPGTHTLSVKVTKNDESYSKTVVFSITE